MFENTKYEIIYDLEFGSEFRGMIVDVVDADVEMQRLDRRSGDENFETFEQIFPMSIELCFVRFRVFFTRAEMQGVDIWEDAFGWYPGHLRSV